MNDAVPFADRFWSKVDRRGECWLWLAAVDKDGYGKFQINHRSQRKQTHVRAHRVAFFLAHGHWPLSQALHSCDNPRCCRPDHIRDGSQSENLIDRAVRGRHPGARLTPDVVRSIRRRRATGEPIVSIATDVGASHGAVRHAIVGLTWGHVT